MTAMEAEVDITGMADAREVCAIAGITIPAIRCRMDRETMPKPKMTVNRKYYWDRQEIVEWVASQAPPPMPQWPEGKRHVTVRDLADALGKSANAIRIMRKRGHLPPPASLSGGRVWWDRRTIEQWLMKEGMQACLVASS